MSNIFFNQPVNLTNGLKMFEELQRRKIQLSETDDQPSHPQSLSWLSNKVFKFSQFSLNVLSSKVVNGHTIYRMFLSLVTDGPCSAEAWNETKIYSILS